jgi:shikimate dehydrogenase
MNWINKDTEIYCSFATNAGNTGCQMMNSAFYYYGLNKIYKSFSVQDIETAVIAVRTLGIKGFAITMPYKVEVLDFIDWTSPDVDLIGAANTVINENGHLRAYNTDFLAAKKFLQDYDYKLSFSNTYILGNGGYAAAVKTAMKHYNIKPIIITRDNWDSIKDIKDSLIYNCSPVENLPIHESNQFIDCIVTTPTGLKLAGMQAEHQFKMYTGLKFPY